MGFRIQKLIHGVGLTAVLLAGLAGSVLASDCADDRVDLRGDWGSARFSVEIADDDKSRGQGLMHRKSMAMSTGMLFIYPRPQHAAFWMRNTLIALDMIFLDATGRVVRVHENAIPLDETTIDGGNGVLAVLEINAGLSKAVGISVGSQLRHPSFSQEIAIWPCSGD
ncbi:MAG: DUF192 domain-containing protein [Marinosulfonomonas sp.]|nr:DUF192 domain-containing protein [Marinosulfonomonas sp.]